MKVLDLKPTDVLFTYKGVQYTVRNMSKNKFTGTWSFDLYWKGGTILGVPITTGTSIIKGNGVPIKKMIFLDLVSSDGDVTYPANTRLYILED